MSIDIERWTGVETAALRHAQRMTIPEFADAVKVTSGAVDRWEARGAAAVIRDHNQAKLDDMLAGLRPGAEKRMRRSLGLLDLPTGAPDGLAATLDDGGNASSWSPGEVIYVSLSRRRFFAGAGALALGASALPPDTDYMTYFGNLRNQVIDDDNLWGSPGVVASVEQGIDRMSIVRRAGVVDNAAMLRMQVIFGEFASWLYQDMQDFDKAEDWANRAMSWSIQLGDDYYTSFVLIRQASIAADRGNGSDAVGLAEAAERHAPPDSKLVGAAATFAGHGHALQHDDLASGREYDRARTVVANANVDPTWAFWLDQAYIDVHQAHSLNTLGDPHGALDRFGASLDGVPVTYARDRGVYQSWHANAHLAIGNAAAAAALAREALTIGIGTRSARILHQVSAVHDQLDDASTEPAIVGLRTAMTKLTT